MLLGNRNLRQRRWTAKGQWEGLGGAPREDRAEGFWLPADEQEGITSVYNQRESRESIIGRFEMTLFEELQSRSEDLYPDRTVVAAFDDTSRADEVLDAVVLDFGRMNVSVLFGETGLRALDPEGVHHGLLGRAYRLLQRTISDASEDLRVVEMALRTGGFVVYVSVDGADQKMRAVEHLKYHGAHYVAFVGRAVIDRH